MPTSSRPPTTSGSTSNPSAREWMAGVVPGHSYVCGPRSSHPPFLLRRRADRVPQWFGPQAVQPPDAPFQVRRQPIEGGHAPLPVARVVRPGNRRRQPQGAENERLRTQARNLTKRHVIEEGNLRRPAESAHVVSVRTCTLEGVTNQAAGREPGTADSPTSLPAAPCAACRTAPGRR